MPKNKAINAINIVPNVNSVIRSWNKSEYVTYMIIALPSSERGQKENGSPSLGGVGGHEPPTAIVRFPRNKVPAIIIPKSAYKVKIYQNLCKK